MLGIGIQQRNPDAVSALLSGSIPILFGALTRANEGSVPVGGSAIVDGDPGGHWQISGGRLSPSAAGEDVISGTYDLTLDDDTKLVINVAPGTASVDGADELRRFADGTHAFFTGGTLSLRPGEYDIRSWRGRTNSDNPDAFMRRMFINLPDPVVVQSANLQDRAVLNGWKPQGDATADIDGTTSVNLTDLNLRHVIVRGSQTRTSAPFWGLWAGGSVVEFLSCADCSITDCLIEGDILGADVGGFAYEVLVGVKVEDFKAIDANGVRWPSNARITIARNEIRRVQTAVSIQAVDCTISYNEIYDIHGGDFFSHQSDAHRARYVGNLLHSPDGDQTRRHPDGLQLNVSSAVPLGSEDMVYELNHLFVLTKGRIFYEAGDNIGGPRTIVNLSNDPIHETNASYIYTTAATVPLDLSLANCELRLFTPDGGSLGVDLPSAASTEGFAFCVRGMTNGGTYSMNFQPGEGHEDPMPASINLDGFSALSDGSSTWRDLGPQRIYYEQQVTGTRNVTPDHCGIGFVMGLSGADEKVVLPDGATADTYPWVQEAGNRDFLINARVYYPGLNTYSVEASGSDQIRMPDGSLVTSFGIEHGKSFRVRWEASEGVWIAVSRAGSVQPFFGNAALYRPTIRYNVFNGIATNGVLMQSGFEEGLIHDNICFNAIEAGEDQLTPFQLRAITTSTPGTDCLAWRNVVIGGEVSTAPSAAGTQPGSRAHNFTLDADQPLSEIYPLFGGTVPDDLRASSPSEALQILRPRPDAEFWTNGISSLGPTPSEGRVGPGRVLNVSQLDDPALVSSIPPAGSVTPNASVIDLEFNHPIEIGSGAIEIWRVDTDVVLGSFDLATALEVSVVNHFTLRLDHGIALPLNVPIEVRLPAGAVTSRAYGTSFSGLGATDLRFSIEASAISPTYPSVDFGTDIPSPENFRYPDYEPGGTQAIDKAVFAYRGTPALNNLRETFLHTSNLVVRIEQTGRAYFKFGNHQITLNGVIPTDGAPLEMYMTWDGTQSNTADGLKLVLNGVPVDTSGVGWLNNRTVALAGQDLSVFYNSANAGRNVTGQHLVTFFDQPSVLPDITQASVRDRLDPLVVGQAVASGDWSQTLSGRQPQILVYGDQADILATVNRGTATSL